MTPLPRRLAEIRYAVDQGAAEIDIVIHRAQVLMQDWTALYDEVAAMREACGAAHMKAVLATGYRSSEVELCRQLLSAIQPGSIVTKDRNFGAYDVL